MNEHDRLSLEDYLQSNMILWADDDELNWWPTDPWTFKKWMRVLEHEQKDCGCCKKCGHATTCLASLFRDSVVTSVIRELNRIGALRMPPAAEQFTEDMTWQQKRDLVQQWAKEHEAEIEK